MNDAKAKNDAVDRVERLMIELGTPLSPIDSVPDILNKIANQLEGLRDMERALAERNER